MKVLVATASKHGSTLELAGAIGEALRSRGLDVGEMPVAEVDDVHEYDAVVLGSGIYGGRWLKPAKEFVERNADALAAVPVWLFSSGPLGDPPKPVEMPIDAEPMTKATGAREHRVFAGSLLKSRLGFAERAMVKAVHAPFGDFRDWDAVQEWAFEIADALVVNAGVGT
jgi:menaquinone-dependent protoporphyrinogen oxidase